MISSLLLYAVEIADVAAHGPGCARMLVNVPWLWGNSRWFVSRHWVGTPQGCYLGEPAGEGLSIRVPLPHQFSTPIFHHPTSHCTISLTCNFWRHPFILGPSADLICLPLLHLSSYLFTSSPSFICSPWAIHLFVSLPFPFPLWRLCCFLQWLMHL